MRRRRVGRGFFFPRGDGLGIVARAQMASPKKCHLLFGGTGKYEGG